MFNNDRPQHATILLSINYYRSPTEFWLTASLKLQVNLAANIHEANVIRHYLAANFVVRKAFHVQTSVREQSEVIKPAYPFQRECIKASVKLNEK